MEGAFSEVEGLLSCTFVEEVFAATGFVVAAAVAVAAGAADDAAGVKAEAVTLRGAGFGFVATAGARGAAGFSPGRCWMPVKPAAAGAVFSGALGAWVA